MQNILALDIGSTTYAVIAQVDESKHTKIIGSGVSKSKGFNKGSITNMDLASKSIKEAVANAKKIAGVDCKKAIVSISGAYTKSTDGTGYVNVTNGEINKLEIQRSIQQAINNASIPQDYEILHTLPYDFKVDEQDNIEDPLGMNANKLEAYVHIITTRKSNLINIKKIMNMANIQIENIILSSYASCLAVLSPDDKKLGACLIDIGGTTSNLAIYSGNSIRYNDFLAVGSNHITKDLSTALSTPLDIAESVKINYGSLKTPSTDLIKIPKNGEDNMGEISLEVVYNVIYARVEETLMCLSQSIDESGLKNHIGAGIALTGGLSKIDGIKELAQNIFETDSIRIAKPKSISGIVDTIQDPSYSTVIGLVLYAIGEKTPYAIDLNEEFKNESNLKEIAEINDISKLNKNIQENFFTNLYQSIKSLFTWFGNDKNDNKKNDRNKHGAML